MRSPLTPGQSQELGWTLLVVLTLLLLLILSSDSSPQWIYQGF